MDHSNLTASPWVVRFAPLIPANGPVLDLACGRGRHATYLADRGHPVIALDRNRDSLATLEGKKNIETREVDLENDSSLNLGNRCFAGVIVTNYLFRPIFNLILSLIHEHGVLIYETFAVGNERYGKPANPNFLLRQGELLDIVHPVLHVVSFEDGFVHKPRPSVVQRICAVKSSNDEPNKLG